MSSLLYTPNSSSPNSSALTFNLPEDDPPTVLLNRYMNPHETVCRKLIQVTHLHLFCKDKNHCHQIYTVLSTEL